MNFMFILGLITQVSHYAFVSILKSELWITSDLIPRILGKRYPTCNTVIAQRILNHSSDFIFVYFLLDYVFLHYYLENHSIPYINLIIHYDLFNNIYFSLVTVTFLN